MIKGQHRKMFRKPGLARQALGILASSGELMKEVQPRMQMAQAGAVNKSLFDQATNLVNSMIEQQGSVTLPLRMMPNAGALPAGAANVQGYTPRSYDEAVNAVYRDLISQQVPAPRLEGYMSPADGPIDTTAVRGLPAAVRGDGIAVFDPDYQPPMPEAGRAINEAAGRLSDQVSGDMRRTQATIEGIPGAVRDAAGRAVVGATTAAMRSEGLQNLAGTVGRDVQSTVDAITAPNEAARRAVGQGATASQDGAIDTRGIRDLPIEAARAVRGDGIAVFDPNYKPPMAEAGEAINQSMRNLRETVSRDTGSMLDSIRSLGARLAEPSDKEKEEQKIQDRLDQQTQLAEMLKAGGVKDDDKDSTGSLTQADIDARDPDEGRANEDEDSPPTDTTPTAKEADKNDKEAVGTALDQWKEVTGDDDDNNFWNAVMIAGLGIAAGDSADPLMNIAKGALAGIQQYNKNKKADEQTKFMRFMKQQELDLAQRRVEATEMTAEASMLSAEAKREQAQRGLRDTDLVKQYEMLGDTMSDADKVRYVGSTDKQAAMDDIRLEQAYGLTKGKKEGDLIYPPAGGVYKLRAKGKVERVR